MSTNVQQAWGWKATGHINVLESRSYVSRLRRLVERGGDRRFCALLDSKVAKGPHAKGRSWPSLLRGCAFVIAGNLHPSLGFAPARLNTADVLTRFNDLPVSARHSILDFSFSAPGCSGSCLSLLKACRWMGSALHLCGFPPLPWRVLSSRCHAN